MIYPPKPQPGDRVAILSPSAGLPAIFPDVYELGLTRLADELGLVPVEYPTTRVMGAPAADRAADIHAAFADPTIKAVMASVGGDDQITVNKHLDSDLLIAHPKPFFGYSDNTNLLNFLFNAGVVSYHGGSILVHLGRGGALNPDSQASLRAAVFSSDWYDLAPAARWTDQPGDWRDPASLLVEPEMFDGEGWTWHHADRVIEGPTWGGNIEILSWLTQVGRDIRPASDYAGHVFFFESSEEMPPAEEVYRILRNLGERGLLAQFPAILVGRPKAWEHSHPTTAEQKREFVEGQRNAVLRAAREYAPDAMLVFNLDIGHTDPQLIIPYGGDIRVDGIARTISVRY